MNPNFVYLSNISNLRVKQIYLPYFNLFTNLFIILVRASDLAYSGSSIPKFSK